jgi:hypothetical protein
VRRLNSEFQGEFPSGDCHGDILSSDRLSRIVGCLLWLGNLIIRNADCALESLTVI